MSTEVLNDYLRKINNIFKAIDKYYPEHPEIIVHILEHGSNKLTCENVSLSRAFGQLNVTGESDGYSNNQSLPDWGQTSSDDEFPSYSRNTSRNLMVGNEESNVASTAAITAAVLGIGLAGLWAYRRYND